MSDVDPTLRAAIRASQRVRRAEEQLERARADFYAELQAARAKGASLSALARALGVSRQRMQKLVERLERD